MKKKIALVVGLFLIGGTLYAANGDLIVNGKLGVGTTGPSAKLDVVSSENSSWGVQIANNGTTGAHGLYVNIGASSTGVPFRVDKGSNVLFQVANNGNVGIGTVSPESKLHIIGNGAYSLIIRTSNNLTNNLYIRDDGSAYIRAAAWSYGSDRRLKKNIEYIHEGLDKIAQLKPVKFDYIAGQMNQLGFIAQDVQAVIPEAVSVSDEKTGMLGLKTEFIIPYLVNAIKEQQREIEELKKILAEKK